MARSEVGAAVGVAVVEVIPLVSLNEPSVAAPHAAPAKPSVICGQRGATLLYGHWICDHCKDVVTAEAISKRRKIEMEGTGLFPLDRSVASY